MKKTAFLLLLLSLSVFGQSKLPESALDISPLLIGEVIPNGNVQTLNNKNISLRELTKNKKTILVFFRGGWCPYCNTHLSALGEAEEKLLALGYQIIAISPDAPQELNVIASKNNTNYSLLSDSSGELSKEFGIAYAVPRNYIPYIKKGSNGINTSFLPVPSLFVINKDNEIVFEYINPNYKTRITNKLLVAVASSLQL